MLCVSLAVICDERVGSSWLNSWLSYPGGLIIFNPLDELRPDLHAGGQSLPVQPNIQSITIFNKVSFIFLNTREFIHGRKPKRISTQGRKKRSSWVFANTALREATHFPQASASSSSSSLSFLVFAKAFPSHSIIQSEDINHT